MHWYRSVCPLDCFAHCGLLVAVDSGKVVSVKGDPDHPLTRGMVCSKAKKHVERTYSSERILAPLLREKQGFRQISWGEAYDIIAERLSRIKQEYGSLALLHHSGSGYEGMLADLATRFCNAYGGPTVPEGSTCWGAGYAAQTYDFGTPGTHDWSDLSNSRCIVLWGRDPSRTNIHVIPHIRQAQQNGARLLVINPLSIDTPGKPDLHIAPRPGTDGALALAMAHVIINEGLIDRDFISQHVHGYSDYSRIVEGFSPRRAAEICDVPEASIQKAARMYARHKPAAILLGYGLQRYSNGGQTVRAIDALCAITGNIGVPGGGASYAHSGWKHILGDLKGNHLAHSRRTIPWPRLGTGITEADDPPIRAILVTRSNPVTQLAHTARVKSAFAQAEFVVVVDFFINDTAGLADIILPPAGPFEHEDVVCNSWSPYIALAPQIIQPLGETRSDAQIFCDLARHMGLYEFGPTDPAEWLEQVLRPATSYGVSLERLRQGPIRHPFVGPVAWQDRKFKTPSGKFELYSSAAASAGISPLPDYIPAKEAGAPASAYTLHLLTPHHSDYLHSQFVNLKSNEDTLRTPVVWLHPQAAKARGLADGDRATVATAQGTLSATVRIADSQREDTAVIFQGGWHKFGAGVNLLTPERESDMGLTIAYYDCTCEVKREGCA